MYIHWEKSISALPRTPQIQAAPLLTVYQKVGRSNNRLLAQTHRPPWSNGHRILLAQRQSPVRLMRPLKKIGGKLLFVYENYGQEISPKAFVAGFIHQIVKFGQIRHLHFN